MTRVPIGAIMAWPAAVAPSGWHIIDGTTISRTTYAELLQFAIDNGLLGTVFGVGDGVTTFSLPNAAGKILCAPESGFALGSSRGAAMHTNTVAEMAAHRHVQNLWGPNFDDYPAECAGGSGTTNYDWYMHDDSNGSGVVAVQTGSTGTGTAYSILNPQLGMNFIMYIGGVEEDEGVVEKLDTLNTILSNFIPGV